MATMLGIAPTASSRASAISGGCAPTASFGHGVVGTSSLSHGREDWALAADKAKAVFGRMSGICEACGHPIDRHLDHVARSLAFEFSCLFGACKCTEIGTRTRDDFSKAKAVFQQMADECEDCGHPISKHLVSVCRADDKPFACMVGDCWCSKIGTQPRTY